MDEVKERDYERMAYILQKDVWTLEEACFYLNIAPSYMYKLTSRRKIPHYCPWGKLLYFNKAEVIDWIQKKKRKSGEQIESETFENLLKIGKDRRRKNE